MTPPMFTRNNLPNRPRPWPVWRKKSLTQAVRIEGPFCVQSREGVQDCEDGWLAIDSDGYPYPIADEEFRRIYEPADDF